MILNPWPFCLYLSCVSSAGIPSKATMSEFFLLYHFFKIYFYFCLFCVCVVIWMSAWSMEITWRSSPSTMCVPGIEIWQSGIIASAFLLLFGLCGNWKWKLLSCHHLDLTFWTLNEVECFSYIYFLFFCALSLTACIFCLFFWSVLFPLLDSKTYFYITEIIIYFLYG